MARNKGREEGKRQGKGYVSRANKRGNETTVAVSANRDTPRPGTATAAAGA